MLVIVSNASRVAGEVAITTVAHSSLSVSPCIQQQLQQKYKSGNSLTHTHTGRLAGSQQLNMCEEAKCCTTTTFRWFTRTSSAGERDVLNVTFFFPLTLNSRLLTM